MRIMFAIFVLGMAARCGATDPDCFNDAGNALTLEECQEVIY